MGGRDAIWLSPVKKVVLSVAGGLVLIAPVGLRLVNAPAVHAQSQSGKERKAFEVALRETPAATEPERQYRRWAGHLRSRPILAI